MTDLVTFGEAILRLSPPDDERLETADSYDVHLGGAESNVAVACQRLGLDATWTSKLVDSPLGRKVAGTLRQFDVDVSVTWSESGRQGTYYLETGDEPRGHEVVYDRANATVTTATPADVALDRIEAADGFHTTGITAALSDQLAETTATLLERATAAGTTTSFDVNYRSKLWSPEAARETLTDLFPDIDVLVVAQRDAHDVLDISGDSTAIARDLDQTYDFEVVIVTGGDDGAVALIDDSVHQQSAFEATDAYPVGTGDAFVGGFLSQYLPGGSVSESLSYAAATAAMKRSVPGDMAIVSASEIDAMVGNTDGDNWR